MSKCPDCERLTRMHDEDSAEFRRMDERAHKLNAERDRLREELTVARATSMGPIQHYIDRLRAALERIAHSEFAGFKIPLPEGAPAGLTAIGSSGAVLKIVYQIVREALRGAADEPSEVQK